MAYISTRLSTCVALGFAGGPEWSTLVVNLENGREQRNAQWLYPKHKYSAQYMNLDADARDEILEAFHAARGQLHVFRFKDWNDYKCTHEPLSPDIGTSNPVQFIKTYTLGSQTSTRLIQAPTNGIITRNGNPVTGSLDNDTGLFTPSVPWVAGTYTFSCEFDVWVRFASDYNAFVIGNKNAHTADVELIEVRR